MKVGDFLLLVGHMWLVGSFCAHTERDKLFLLIGSLVIVLVGCVMAARGK